jgi:tagatose 6-phosphate kinase
MILTVTLNPLVERRFIYDEAVWGRSNRNDNDYLTAGGKGINVSRELTLFDIDNLAFTFAGGNTGKLLKKLLNEEHIKASFVQTADETRNSSIVIDKKNNTVTTFFGKNSDVTESEAAEFLEKLEKMILNCEIVVFSGSSPSPATDHIFAEGIRLANKSDKISILDTYGKFLPECLKASPTVVHNNLDEIKDEFNVTDEDSIYSLLHEFYSYGIKQVYITNSRSDVYASNFDFHFRIQNPPVLQKDPTGSGDAFTAGIVYGWHNNLTFEETAIIASCLGAANAAVYDTCKISLSEAGEYRDNVKVSPVGKKMKIIDVTPR